VSRDVTPERPDETSSANPATEQVAFGQRMEIHRLRRGMSRPVLAGLLGMSPSWVKQVEKGVLRTPSLPMILRIAEVLRVRNLSELTGDQSMPIDLFIGPGHVRLPAVRAALDVFPLTADREAPATPHLRARLARAWSARHSAPNHREVIGVLLPDLIRDAQLAVRQTDRAADRRAAQAVLAEVYFLSQFFIAYQPDSALLWRVAERGMIASQESEDPHALGVAAWLAVQGHRDAARYDAADAVTSATLRFLEPLLPDANDDVRAIAGALQFEAGYTAARRGDTGTAWGWWDKARDTAKRLPASYYHPVTSFSQAIIGAHAVTVAVELHAGGESARQAAAADASTIPSRPRRARHRIEEARGYQLDGQPDTALATLKKAFECAPETIRYNGYARRIILEETESRSPARRHRAAELAVSVGILAS
jgi:transcriptional regulator with XRE-family HTH domain